VYGLAYGLLASQAGFRWQETGVMGVVVLAGAAQIVATERLAAGAGVVAALVAGVALNLRLILITASIRHFFIHRPLWQRLLGAHFSTDENWALTLAKRNRGEAVEYWFLVGSGLMLLIAWAGFSVLGVLFAGHIPEAQSYGLDFAFTAAFIALARGLWRGHQDLIPWLLAASVVVLTRQLELMDTSWALVLGGISGAVLAGVRRHE